MSTTKSPEVAFDYSGGATTVGSIMTIDFDMNSRGASLQWASQYPHEEELCAVASLPCTAVADTCADVLTRLRSRAGERAGSSHRAPGCRVSTCTSTA